MPVARMRLLLVEGWLSAINGSRAALQVYLAGKEIVASTRTIDRDLARLAGMGMPYLYDHATGRYTLHSTPADEVPDAAAALALAQDNITLLLSAAKQAAQLARFGIATRALPAGHTQYVAYLQPLVRGLKLKLWLRIAHAKFGLEAVTHIVAPYHICEREGYMYLIGIGHPEYLPPATATLKAYALDRVEHIQETNTAFEPDPTLNIPARLAQMVGISGLDKPPSVLTLAFSKQQWRYQQAYSALPTPFDVHSTCEHTIQASYHVVDNYELHRYLAGLGEDCVVVGDL